MSCQVEKLEMVKALIGEDPDATDALLSVYLNDAGAAILRRRYPFGAPEGAMVPGIYSMLQVKLAARYFFRRGGEGEIRHNENGIDRTYGTVNDEDLLMEVTPYAKVIGT